MNIIQDEELYNEVLLDICYRCGTDFEKPGTCEECIKKKRWKL